MNAGATRAARSDRRLGGQGVDDVPREFKRTWARLNHKEKAKLRRQWNVSQIITATQGAIKNRSGVTDQAFDSLQKFSKKVVK